MTEQEMVMVTVNPFQMTILKSALELEIKTEGRFKATREPALKIYQRLLADKAGIKVGRGQKGRLEALEVVETLLAQIKAERPELDDSI
jgi:hypothetical protein